MKGLIDVETLNIQTVPSFIEPQMVEAETYDFDISPTMNRGASVPEPSVFSRTSCRSHYSRDPKDTLGNRGKTSFKSEGRRKASLKDS